MKDSDQLVKRFLSLFTEQQAEFLRKLSQQGIKGGKGAKGIYGI